MGFPHGIHVFKTCSSVSPFHSPWGMDCSSVTLPLDNRSCHKIYPRVGFSSWIQLLPLVFSWVGSPQVVSSLRKHSAVLLWGSSWTAGGSLLHSSSPWAAGRQPDSPWSAPGAAGESLPQHLEHFLPLLLHWAGWLQGCFAHIFSLLSSSSLQ